MPNILLRLDDEQHKDLKKLKPNGKSWGEFIHSLATGGNKLSMQEGLSLEEIRQEIKDHLEEHIQTPTVKTYNHTDVVDDVKEHLLAHMQNKHTDHQVRHDEQDNKINSLAAAIHKITNIMPSLNNNVPNTTMHKIRNKTDILELVESCAFKP